jgi:hypothetical protein
VALLVQSLASDIPVAWSEKGEPMRRSPIISPRNMQTDGDEGASCACLRRRRYARCSRISFLPPLFSDDLPLFRHPSYFSDVLLVFSHVAPPSPLVFPPSLLTSPWTVVSCAAPGSLSVHGLPMTSSSHSLTSDGGSDSGRRGRVRSCAKCGATETPKWRKDKTATVPV